MATSNIQESQAEVIRRIAATLNPEKIYLFGSHAWGEARPDSDIDLFIIVKESNLPAYRRAYKVYQALRGVRGAFEVVVRTVAEVEQGKSVTSSLVKKVLEQGKLLYG